MNVFAKIRINKNNGQKQVTIPKQDETKKWGKGQLVEIKKAEMK